MSRLKCSERPYSAQNLAIIASGSSGSVAARARTCSSSRKSGGRSGSGKNL